MSRRPLAFSLVEITLIFVLLAAAAALIMPRLLSGDQAATARRAQSSLELTASAALDLSVYAGGPSADLSSLAELAPRLSFLDSTAASTGPDAVSVYSNSSTFLAAASDSSGFCWGLVLTFSSSGQSSVYLTTESSSCTASLFTAQIGVLPPVGSGSSWSSPWVL